VLSGSEALARALGASRIRSAWSFPGAPLTTVQQLLESKSAAGVTHHYAVNESVAVSLAFGGALLSGHGTCALLRDASLTVALPSLASFAIINELRSPLLLVEGFESPTSHDNRAALSDMLHLPQLEAGSPDELYAVTRLATQASQRGGLPVVVRTSATTLETRAAVAESPPELPEGPLMLFSRGAGPFMTTGELRRHHVEKRARRLQQLEAFVAALSIQTTADSSRGVILAGTLGPAAHARSWSRRLPTLRLGASWPLPRQTLIDFMKGRDEILVLEEGEPFLERELQALAHREWLECRVRGAGDARTARLDGERVDTLLGRFAGRVRAEVDPVVRTPQDWKAAAEALAPLGADDGEPWPLFVSRTRGQLPAFRANDGRQKLLTSLRELDRPTIIVSSHGGLGLLGVRDRLVDVKMALGSAAPIAGALADAGEVEEQPGAPLAVALVGDVGLHHGELAGILDNAIARREVLHVIVVNRRARGETGTPTLEDDAIDAQLRAVGLHVATASIADPGLGAAVAYSASRHGPRALICYANASNDELDG
jgi:TPP-dependent indolepyruvate ferredoxin oxidoreductase alpha subunit